MMMIDLMATSNRQKSRHPRMLLAGICGLVIRFRLKATGMTLVGATGMTLVGAVE